MFGFCLPASLVPHFRPDTGGRRWSLIQVVSSVALRGGAGAAFPSTLLRLPVVLHRACPALRAVPALGVFHKSPEQKAAACFLCLPRPSGSGSQELDGSTLPGCGAPSPLQGCSLSFCPHQSGACALCPPRPQPQSPPALVGCVRPVSRCDPPSGCRPCRISGSL